MTLKIDIILYIKLQSGLDKQIPSTIGSQKIYSAFET